MKKWIGLLVMAVLLTGSVSVHGQSNSGKYLEDPVKDHL
jgi:hypothetical protein